MNVDGAVRRVRTDYDGQGNAYLLTNYTAPTGGTVVSQVQRSFNGLGQLTAEYQAHGATVDTATTPKVQYAYSPLDATNKSRLLSMTYPNGRVVASDYGTAGQLNDKISRLSALKDGTTTLEAYAYLGLGTVVTRSHPQPGIDLTYVKRAGEADGDAGDPYTGIDRFGRVVDQRWVVAASGVAADRFGYTLDRDGNRLTKSNGVNAAFGEAYTYDGLNQLASFARGTRTQSWDYDSLGNWSGVTTDGATQTRTANAQNEITGVSGAVTPTYDASGNMTGDETGRQFVYDAWNRLKVVKSPAGVVLETLGYDALNRRITAIAGGATTDLYYSANWQVLEERVGGVARASYVWSPVYVDALVSRDRDADGAAGNGLEERLYALADANYNVTALVSVAGVVAERYVYDAFGKASVLDASFAAKAGGTGYGWAVLFQGLLRDSVSGLDHARNRDYSATLGRWVTMDPIGFAAGDVNLYRMENNDTLRKVDPSGTDDSNVETVKSLKPNGPGFGRRFFHQQTVTLDYSTMEGSEKERYAKLFIVGKSIFDGMKKFKGFNDGNIADALSPFEVDGSTYTGFRNAGLDGVLAGAVSGDGPENRSYVKLKFDETDWSITATTLGNHLLVGKRVWAVRLDVKGCSAKIIIHPL